MGEYELENLEYEGYNIVVEYDPNPHDFDPRQDDNLGTMICFHSGYSLGDEHKFSSNQEFLDSFKDREDVRTMERDVVMLPLYLYDHSGITMSCGDYGDRWDSGQVGWIYMTRKKWEGEGVGEWTHKNVTDWLKSEVGTYAGYLEGRVYSFTVTDPEGEEVESVGGFLGEVDEVINEAKAVIRWNKKPVAKEA